MAVKEFDCHELDKLTLSHNLLNMLTKIHEHKGKQDCIWQQQMAA